MSQLSQTFGLPARARRDVEMYEEDDQLRRAKELRDMRELVSRLGALSITEDGTRAPAQSVPGAMMLAGAVNAASRKRPREETARESPREPRRKKARVEAATAPSPRAASQREVKGSASGPARSRDDRRRRAMNKEKARRTG